MSYLIQHRLRTTINRDTLNRVYDGAIHKPEEVWTAWGLLEGPFESVDAAEQRLLFWRSLNDHAVRERGPSALREFRVVLAAEASA